MLQSTISPGSPWWLSSADSRRSFNRTGLTDSKRIDGALEQEWLGGDTTFKSQGSAMIIISEKLRVAAKEGWTTKSY